MTDPITPGDTGEAVRDLQVRLSGAGHDVGGDRGEFGEATESAVRAFQAERGLRIDGICGRQTWSALVESGYALGDRLLYLRRPMLRGDDVGDLQHQLNALGFDAGREDAIFGPDTAGALIDFQRNAAIMPDAICGPASLAELRRVGSLARGSIAALKEREALRATRQIPGTRVYLASEPGLEALAESVGRELSLLGADVVVNRSATDESAVADAANRFEAGVCLSLRLGDTPGCCCSFFESGRFRSEAGFHLAGRLLEELTKTGLAVGGARGRTYTLLRETRMPAVVCEPVEAGDVAAMRRLVSGSGAVARAVALGVQRGVEEPPDD